MQLPGRLVRTTLGDLLGGLYRTGASGMLELSVVATGKRHRIHLKRGFVTQVELDTATPPARLGEILAGEGLAPRLAIERALERQEALGSGALPQGEILVRAGVLSAEVRDAALRRQTRARLDALFGLLDGRDAEVRFHVGIAATSTRKQTSGPLLPREFLHGRPRARDGRKTADPQSSPPTGAVRPGAFERLRALRVLGLGPGADEETIRRTFRAAAARVHPDRHQGLPAADRARLQSALAELSAAYHLLCA
jgi:hypothetical protein